uniref:Family with sequence similarity 110 member C n=1 Tax=Papio anubis TaxID=9555 RepID=A0A8I5R559_PAPAN
MPASSGDLGDLGLSESGFRACSPQRPPGGWQRSHKAWAAGHWGAVRHPARTSEPARALTGSATAARLRCTRSAGRSSPREDARPGGPEHVRERAAPSPGPRGSPGPRRRAAGAQERSGEAGGGSRQKCEFMRGAGADGPRASLVKKLFQGPGKDKAPLPRAGDEGKAGNPETVPTKPGAAADPAPPETPAPAARSAAPSSVPAAPPGPEPREVRRRGLQRSQSDLSSRYSALAESDTFFQFCGLDPEVVEALGRENFTAGSDRVTLMVRSVSVATSGSGFSRHSGGDDDGLQEEELIEQVPSTTSVIERNARIIKWLYTCKKAKETPSQEQSRTRGSKPSR